MQKIPNSNSASGAAANQVIEVKDLHPGNKAEGMWFKPKDVLNKRWLSLENFLICSSPYIYLLAILELIWQPFFLIIFVSKSLSYDGSVV